MESAGWNRQQDSLGAINISDLPNGPPGTRKALQTMIYPSEIPLRHAKDHVTGVVKTVKVAHVANASVMYVSSAFAPVFKN